MPSALLNLAQPNLEASMAPAGRTRTWYSRACACARRRQLFLRSVCTADLEPKRTATQEGGRHSPATSGGAPSAGPPPQDRTGPPPPGHTTPRRDHRRRIQPLPPKAGRATAKPVLRPPSQRQPKTTPSTGIRTQALGLVVQRLEVPHRSSSKPGLRQAVSGHVWGASPPTVGAILPPPWETFHRCSHSVGTPRW